MGNVYNRRYHTEYNPISFQGHFDTIRASRMGRVACGVGYNVVGVIRKRVIPEERRLADALKGGGTAARMSWMSIGISNNTDGVLNLPKGSPYRPRACPVIGQGAQYICPVIVVVIPTLSALNRLKIVNAVCNQNSACKRGAGGRERP